VLQEIDERNRDERQHSPGKGKKKKAKKEEAADDEAARRRPRPAARAGHQPRRLRSEREPEGDRRLTRSSPMVIMLGVIFVSLIVAAILDALR